MHKLLICTAALAGLCAQALAAPPVYQNGELSLDHAVVIRAGEGLYYRDLSFARTTEGTWRLSDATPAQLAVVEEVSVVAEATLPPLVTVTLEGYKSLPCVGLEPVGISQQGKQFHVVLAETEIPPNVRCITIIEPFTHSFELNTRGLEPGEYQVIANGVTTEFTLPAP